MSDTTPVVYVADDDISVRESVETMVAEAGFPMTVQAMKAGAIEFLTKPFSPEALLAAICSAVERSRTFLAQQLALKALREREKSLSRRERDVMALVIRGQLNKQVGAALGISEITVKAHRGQVMRKMHAKSLADLVMMATRLRQTPEES